MPTSNIDDLLLSVKTSTQPATPENQYLENNEVEDESIEESAPADYGEDEIQTQDDNGDIQELEDIQKAPVEVDDYGNEKESMPKGLKDRLTGKKSNISER